MLRAMAEAARQRRLFQALFMIRVLVMFFPVRTGTNGENGHGRQIAKPLLKFNSFD